MLGSAMLAVTVPIGLPLLTQWSARLLSCWALDFRLGLAPALACFGKGNLNSRVPPNARVSGGTGPIQRRPGLHKGLSPRVRENLVGPFRPANTSRSIPAEISKRITLHHTFPLPRKPRSALASPKRAVKKKARPKVERPREPVVQDRPTDKETAKHPRAKQTPEQRQEYERARNQTPERREYNRRYAQEQRQQAKHLGKCRDCGKPAIPNQTRCPTCTEAHRQSRRRSDAKRSAAAKEA